MQLERIRFPLEEGLYGALVSVEAGARLEEEWRRGETTRAASALDLGRLQLLRNAVRCSADASPALHKMVQVTQRILGAEFPYEIYQSGGAQPNAACHWSKDRLLLRFTGPIHRLLSPREMLFIVGHEVGHYISPQQRFGAWLVGALEYYAIPEVRSVAEASGDPLPGLLFQAHIPALILLWSRCIEITSDRVGLLCCQQLEPAVTALAKLMAGLDSTSTQVSAADFLAQADEWIEAGVDDPDDWSHPLELLRAKALEAFHNSSRFAEIYPHSDVRWRGPDMNRYVSELLLPPQEDVADEPAPASRPAPPPTTEQRDALIREKLRKASRRSEATPETAAGPPRETEETAAPADQPARTNGSTAVRPGWDEMPEFAFERLTALCCYLAATADGRITPAEKRNVGQLSNGESLLAAWEKFEPLSETELDELFDELAATSRSQQTRRRLSMLIGKLIDIAKADRSFSKDELTVIDTIGEALGVGDLARRRIVGVLGYDPFELG